MTAPPPTIFLSDDAFDLLVRRVPGLVLDNIDAADFERVVGTRRERFEFIIQALGEGGRTQGFIGQETAGYLRNALGAALLALEVAEFQTRTGADREDAMELLRHLDHFVAPRQPAEIVP